MGTKLESGRMAPSQSETPINHRFSSCTLQVSNAFGARPFRPRSEVDLFSTGGASTNGRAGAPCYGAMPYNSFRMTVAVRSFAKINLGLYIGARRADGFHD